jgi:hypothetical protein
MRVSEKDECWDEIPLLMIRKIEQKLAIVTKFCAVTVTMCTSIYSVASRRLNAMQSHCSGLALYIEEILNTKIDEV